MAMKRKLKVLVSAYACEPGKGSEPGVGWNWVKQIAKYHDVWVLTRANNRRAIEANPEKHPLPNIQFCYVDLPKWLRFWKRGQRGIYLYYYLWQLKAYIQGIRLHHIVGFDLVHHITFGNCWMPVPISLLPIPFVWGPIGGAQKPPSSLTRHFRLRNRVYELCRNIGQLLFRLDPFYWLTVKKSKVILACNKDTVKFFPQKYSNKIMLMPQMGVLLAEVPEECATEEENDFTILSVGRLIHWKGFSLAINAFAIFQPKCPNSKLIIVGEGKERKHLQRLVEKNGLQGKVFFAGQQPLHQVMKYMAKCKIFLFPSLHDGNPKVVLEAFASGKPVICLDLGGPGEMVTDQCGIKVKATTPDQVIYDLAGALERVACDATLRRKLGKNARRRAEKIYDWDRKGEQIERLYELVIGKKHRR